MSAIWDATPDPRPRTTFRVEYEDPWWVLMWVDEWGQPFDAQYFATKEDVEQYLEVQDGE